MSLMNEDYHSPDPGLRRGVKGRINDDDEEKQEFYCDVIIDESGKMNNMVKSFSR